MRFSAPILLGLLLANNAAAWSAKGSAQLIELYTSEGCSSCPPADQWFSSLKSQTGLWKSFVPLSFHVNYWDQLGWPDRFATRETTQRQYEHSERWGSRSVYTPAVVLQGKASKAEIPKAPAAFELRAEWDGKELTVSSARGVAGATLHYAWLAMGVSNSVTRGENAGKRLSHDFVVLKFASLGAFESGRKIDFMIPPGVLEKPKALAVWLEKDGAPVVAAGGEL